MQQQWLSLEQLYNSNFWHTADVSNCFKTISRLRRIVFPWNSTKGAIRWQPYAFRPSRVWEVTFRQFRDHRRQILWENAIKKQLLRSWARNDLMWNLYTLNNLTTRYENETFDKSFSDKNWIKAFKLFDMKASDLFCVLLWKTFIVINTKRCSIHANIPIPPRLMEKLISPRDMAMSWQNDFLKNVLKWIGSKFHRLSCCLGAFYFVTVFRIPILRENVNLRIFLIDSGFQWKHKYFGV